MKTLKLIILISVLLLAGCGQVILRDPNGQEIVKINTLFKDINVDEIAYQDWLIKRYSGKSKNVEGLTPYGTFKTTDGKSD